MKNQMKIRWVLPWLLLALAAGAAWGAIPQSERDGLIAIYNNMDGPNWWNQTNWLGPAGTEGTWYGITLNADQTHVIRINLYWNNLIGPIPPEIGNFPALESLNMSQDCKRPTGGPIPVEIGNLHELRELVLGTIGLQGQIPASIGNLTKLQTFIASGDSLTGILPPEMGQLSNLQWLGLAENQIGGDLYQGATQSWVGGLQSLRLIDLRNNCFTGPLPHEFGSLPDLEFFQIDFNQFNEEIPPEFGNLPKLRVLNLGFNQLEGPIPANLGSLTQLTNLETYQNRITGTIPPELANLTSLQSLSLGNNWLMAPEPIPEWLGGLFQLRYLDLRHMNLTGSIPPSMGNLQLLDTIYLENNYISGPIPAEIGNMTQLNRLVLNYNQLSGTIPPEIGQLANLYVFQAANNLLVGPLPDSIWNLHKLGYLGLAQNHLSGTISAGIGDLVLLEDVNLSYNDFEGTIPPEIGALTKVRGLGLQANHFSGELPVELGNLSDLYGLGLSQNAFTGPVPDTLLNLTHLQNGWSHFSWNGLYTNNPTVAALLDRIECCGWDWEATQTIPPADVTIGAVTTDSVVVQWSPILFTSYTGGYRVLYSTTPGGPYTEAGMTNTKLDSALPVNGLEDGVTYYFVVQSVSYPNEVNKNTVESDYSVEVSATTEEAVVAIPQSERDALIAIYNSMNGPNWWNQTNWLGPVGTEGTWYGITLNTDQTHVVIINLYWNNLIGPIPPEIGNFPALEYLNMSQDCQRSTGGPIPVEIGNLHELRALILGTIGLEGEIPSSLGDLTKLEYLILSGNRLTGSIPRQFGQLANLQWLHLGDTQLSGDLYQGETVSWIGGLHNLRFISMFNTLVGGPLPAEFGDLPFLEDCCLFSNRFTGTIPPRLGNLHNLKSLWLLNNLLEGPIPAELGSLTQLTSLRIGYNHLSGTLPPELGNLTSLQTLALGPNLFMTPQPIPAWLFGLSQLNYLDLRVMNLTGEFPSGFGDLHQLQTLHLEGNLLTGPIPPEIGNMTNLNNLWLSRNNLTGSVPVEILNLTHLSDSWNDFTYNGLYTDNPATHLFLDQKQYHGWDWEATQTIPPANITVGAVTTDSAVVQWSPILFTGYTGGYRVLYATSPGGPYTLAGMTPTKLDTAMQVTGLEDGVTHYFVVQSVTFPNEWNFSTVESDYSVPVSATTIPSNRPLELEAGPDQSASEGAVVYLAPAVFTDPDPGDTHAATIDWGDGTVEPGLVTEAAGVGAVDGSHIYADNGLYTVTVTAWDQLGATDSDSLTVTAANAAPELAAISATLDPVRVGTAVAATAPFTDAGCTDTHAATWDWGDGATSAGTVTEAAGSGTVGGSHTYAAPGIYTLASTLWDDDGGSTTSCFEFVVVYDPTGGFVTGGGWILSPPGAYVDDPLLVGKASFGFVSKYQKGASVPTGTTQFTFKVADFDFYSTSYQWLVIAGAKAKYKGAGTVNGAGDYGFLLSATDGQLPGGGGADRFRIKIWDRATGEIVYDNQLGSADDDDPVTALGGGSIVIHKE